MFRLKQANQRRSAVLGLFVVGALISLAAPSAFAAPPPQPEPLAGPRLAIGSQAYISGPPDQGWADDWCHYYVDSGVTYGDLCLTRVKSRDGSLLADRYRLYQYDPNLPNNRGALVMSLFTGEPGWATYRDWSDPRFKSFPDLAWFQHPINDADVNANNFYVVWRNGTKQTVAQITALAAQTGSGGGAGTTPSGSGGAAKGTSGLPAWDPAFWGPNALALKLIHNAETGRSIGGTGSPLAPSLGDPSTGTPKNN